jgi:hypothetical protein
LIPEGIVIVIIQICFPAKQKESINYLKVMDLYSDF